MGGLRQDPGGAACLRVAALRGTDSDVQIARLRSVLPWRDRGAESGRVPHRGPSIELPPRDRDEPHLLHRVGGAGLAAEIAAELAEQRRRRPRVYQVASTGQFEKDPNVTDKKFPGNPTRSCRREAPLQIVGNVTEWTRSYPSSCRRGGNDCLPCVPASMARSSTGFSAVADCFRYWRPPPNSDRS